MRRARARQGEASIEDRQKLLDRTSIELCPAGLALRLLCEERNGRSSHIISFPDVVVGCSALLFIASKRPFVP